MLPKCSTIAVTSINPESPCKHNKTTSNLLRQLHNTKQTCFPVSITWIFRWLLVFPAWRKSSISLSRKQTSPLPLHVLQTAEQLVVGVLSKHETQMKVIPFICAKSSFHILYFKKTNYFPLLQKQTMIAKTLLNM